MGGFNRTSPGAGARNQQQLIQLMALLGQDRRARSVEDRLLAKEAQTNLEQQRKVDITQRGARAKRIYEGTYGVDYEKEPSFKPYFAETEKMIQSPEMTRTAPIGNRIPIDPKTGLPGGASIISRPIISEDIEESARRGRRQAEQDVLLTIPRIKTESGEEAVSDIYKDTALAATTGRGALPTSREREEQAQRVLGTREKEIGLREKEAGLQEKGVALKAAKVRLAKEIREEEGAVTLETQRLSSLSAKYAKDIVDYDVARQTLREAETTAPERARELSLRVQQLEQNIGQSKESHAVAMKKAATDQTIADINARIAQTTEEAATRTKFAESDKAIADAAIAQNTQSMLPVINATKQAELRATQAKVMYDEYRVGIGTVPPGSPAAMEMEKLRADMANARVLADKHRMELAQQVKMTTAIEMYQKTQDPRFLDQALMYSGHGGLANIANRPMEAARLIATTNEARLRMLVDLAAAKDEPTARGIIGSYNDVALATSRAVGARTTPIYAIEKIPGWFTTGYQPNRVTVPTEVGMAYHSGQLVAMSSNIDPAKGGSLQKAVEAFTYRATIELQRFKGNPEGLVRALQDEYPDVPAAVKQLAIANITGLMKKEAPAPSPRVSAPTDLQKTAEAQKTRAAEAGQKATRQEELRKAEISRLMKQGLSYGQAYWQTWGQVFE